MNKREQLEARSPEITVVERRRHRDELSSAEVMKILRRRAAKAGKQTCAIEAHWDEE